MVDDNEAATPEDDRIVEGGAADLTAPLDTRHEGGIDTVGANGYREDTDDLETLKGEGPSEGDEGDEDPSDRRGPGTRVGTIKDIPRCVDWVSDMTRPPLPLEDAEAICAGGALALLQLVDDEDHVIFGDWLHAAKGASGARILGCRARDDDRIYLEDVLSEALTKLAAQRDKELAKRQDASGAVPETIDVVLVELGNQNLVCNPDAISQNRALLQARGVSLILMGSRLPEQGFGDLTPMVPDFRDHWLRILIEDRMPASSEDDRLDVLGQLHDRLRDEQIDRPAELRELLVGGLSWENDEDAVAAFDRLMAEYRQGDPGENAVRDLLSQVFPSPQSGKLELIQDFSAAGSNAAPKEPYATILFTLWDCLRGTAGRAVPREGVETVLRMHLQTLCDRERAEVERSVAALGTDEASAEQRRALAAKVGTVQGFMDNFESAMDQVLPMLLISSRTEEVEGLSLQFAKRPLQGRLSELFMQSRIGFRRERAATVLEQPGLLRHPNRVMRRMAAANLIDRFRDLGALDKDANRARVCADLCKSFELDGTTKGLGGIRPVVEFLEQWVWGTGRGKGHGGLSPDAARQLVTALFRHLFDRETPYHKIARLFREIAFRRNRLDLLDARAVMKMFLTKGSWSLYFLFLRDVAAHAGSTVRGTQDLQLQLFEFLAETLAEDETFHGAQAFFLAGLAVRVVPGYVVRLRWRDYRPLDEDGDWDPMLERLLQRDKGLEEIVAIMTHPTVISHLPSVVHVLSEASTKTSRWWVGQFLDEVDLIGNQIALMNLKLPNVGGEDADKELEKLRRDLLAGTSQEGGGDDDVSWSSNLLQMRGGDLDEDEVAKLKGFADWLHKEGVYSLLAALDLSMAVQLYAAFHMSQRPELGARLGTAFSKKRRHVGVLQRLPAVSERNRAIVRLLRRMLRDTQRKDPDTADDIKFATSFLQDWGDAMTQFRKGLRVRSETEERPVS